jgi:hypothetical protein
VRTIRDNARMGNVQDNWLLRLYFDDEGAADFLGVGDTHYKGSTGNQWHGIVKQIGSIRESIDLAKCTSKVSNVSVMLANVKIDGTLLSDTLSATSGSEVFLNRKVEIYSMLSGQDDIYHQMIYTGRLRGISWTTSEVELDIEPNQPWDFISIPNVQADSGRYFPVVYGDYTTNADGGYPLSFALWPVEVDSASNEGLWGLVHNATTLSTYRLHVHESEHDVFVPLVDSAGNYFYTSSTGYDAAGDAIRVDPDLIHSWKFKPVRISENDVGDFTNPEKSIDDPYADEATTYANVSTLNLGNWDIFYELQDSNFPPYDATAADYQILFRVTYQVSNTAVSPTLYVRFDGTDVGSHAITSTAKTTVTFTIDSADWDVQTLPSEIKLRASRSTPNATACNFYIYDVKLEVVCQVDPTDLADAKRSKQDVDTLYCGGDGLSKSWSSGACVTAQEIHRDMLIRYTGMTAATPDGYAALDTARSGWDARLWLHEPEDIREVLEQLQYEGQFVFAWAVDGDPRYIFVKSSYSSGDVSATIQAGRDTSEIQYSLTPFSEIISKQQIKYERHPADDSRYLSSYTKTNTDRGNFNFATEENTAQIELDYLCAAASSHATITDLVFGAPKKLIACDLLRPELWVLEVGDIVQLENDAAYYMITDATRQQARFSIKAREVG